MSADSELLIKIKTILESQGIDSAKAKLAELVNTQNAAGLSEASANRERSKSEAQAEKTAKAILAMNNAMAGGMGPFRAAVSVANQLGGSFALLAFKASAVGAAMTLGWKIGSTLSDWVTGAKDVATELENLGKASDALRDRVAKLSDIRISNLKIEAEEIAKGFSTAVDKAERLKRLSDLREDAQLAVQLADVNLAFQKGEIKPEERDRLELKYQGESELRKLQTEEKLLNSQAQTSSSKESQARAKYGELSRKAGMSQQDYEQAVMSAKEFGIEDPESLISGGKSSGDYQDQLAAAKRSLKYYQSQQRANRENVLVDHSKQGPIDDQRVADALRKFETLEALPDLKTLADASKKEFEANKPGYAKTMADEAVNQEEIRAKQEVLSDRYKSTHTTYDAKDQALTNQIDDQRRQKELDEAGKTTAVPSAVKRLAAIDLLDTLKLDPKTKRNNAGIPLSEKGQADYDASRLAAAKEAIRMAGVKANQGVDETQVMKDLITSLTSLGARLTGKNSLEAELRKVIARLDGIEGSVKDVQGQIRTAPGLN